MCLAAALAGTVEFECRFGQAFDGGRDEFLGAGALHGSHESVEHAGDYEHFLLADAEQVVIERTAGDDGFGRVVQVRCFIDDYRRIAWSRRDHALAGFRCRVHNRRVRQ